MACGLAPERRPSGSSAWLELSLLGSDPGMATNTQPPASYEALHQENLALRRQIEDIQQEKQAVWQLLVDTNRRLQLLSTAIKASVSSLLSHDIFWSGNNQHEFLETIDASIDHMGQLVNLLALIFRLEAGNLELRCESQALPEIISVLQDHVSSWPAGPRLKVALPREGRPVYVNFEYLVVALEFLLQAAGQAHAEEIRIDVVEEPDRWVLDCEGLTAPCLLILRELLKSQDMPLAPSDALAPDDQLRLFVAFHLLRRQALQIEVDDQPAGPARLRVGVPIPRGL